MKTALLVFGLALAALVGAAVVSIPVAPAAHADCSTCN